MKTSALTYLLLTLVLFAASACADGDRTPVGDAPTATVDGTTPRDDGGPEADGVTSPSDSGLKAQCPVTDYAPCGGDLQGTWRFVSFCPEDQAAADALFEHPYDNLEACKDREANTVVGVSKTEGTMTFSELEVTLVTSGQMDITYGFTDECLAAAISPNMDAESACLSMAASGRLSCSYEASTCSCAGTIPREDENVTTSYQLLDTTTLQLSGGETGSFCQQGDVLIIDWMPHPISWRYWILER